MTRFTPRSLEKSRRAGSNVKDLSRKAVLKSRSPLFLQGKGFSPFKNAVRITKGQLFTIREDSKETESQSSDTSVLNGSRDDVSNISGGEGVSSSDLDGWEDETTLVARLQIDTPRVDDKDALVSLVNQLEGPVEAKGDSLRRYLAHTVAPVAKRIKEANDMLEKKVDVAFGVGIISFDDACKKVEKTALEDEEDWKAAYLESQRNLKGLFGQLNDAYSHRENLWTQLEKSIDDCGSRALRGLSTLPADLEEVIASLEKKAKALNKSGGGEGKSKEKILRDLLGNM